MKVVGFRRSKLHYAATRLDAPNVETFDESFDALSAFIFLRIFKVTPTLTTCFIPPLHRAVKSLTPPNTRYQNKAGTIKKVFEIYYKKREI